MKLILLGTRGKTEASTRRHRRHSALQVSYRRARVMVDCGADWRCRIGELGPQAIVLTHAHPDHAHGLKAGLPVPVFGTEDAWESLADYPIDHDDRTVVMVRQSFEIGGLRFEAFGVEHSARAPAVGYRVTGDLHRRDPVPVTPAPSGTDEPLGRGNGGRSLPNEVLERSIAARARPEDMPKHFLLPKRHEEGECPECGRRLTITEVSGRTTYYCSRDQQLKN